jgi:hypothetical protein
MVSTGRSEVAASISESLLPLQAQTTEASPDFVAVYPLPGSRIASNRTEISLRGVPREDLGAVTVIGSMSGAHSGIIVVHADGVGASFLPDAPFRLDETVTVRAGAALGIEGKNSYEFMIARAVSPPTRLSLFRQKMDPGMGWAFPKQPR